MDKDQILSKKCTIHPSFNAEFLNVGVNSNQRRICFLCIQKNSIPISDVQSIQELLEFDGKERLSSFPPQKQANNKESTVSAQSPEQLIQNISDYFVKLNFDFQQSLEYSKERANNEMKEYLEASQNSQEDSNEFTHTVKLQQAILLPKKKDQSEQELNDIILDAWNESKQQKIAYQENCHILNKIGQYSLIEAQNAARNIIQNVENIRFFVNEQQVQFTLIKSTFNTSEKTKIQQNSEGLIEYVNPHNQLTFGQCYFDFVINPESKYILQIEFEHNSGNSQPYFYFGISSDSLKDFQWVHKEELVYRNDEIFPSKITKMIKGKQIISGLVKNGNRRLEMRVDLKNKYLRVGSLPNYESVSILEDQSLIKMNNPYRFCFLLGQPKDLIRVKKLVIVHEFDNSMNE